MFANANIEFEANEKFSHRCHSHDKLFSKHKHTFFQSTYKKILLVSLFFSRMSQTHFISPAHVCASSWYVSFCIFLWYTYEFLSVLDSFPKMHLSFSMCYLWFYFVYFSFLLRQNISLQFSFIPFRFILFE